MNSKQIEQWRISLKNDDWISTVVDELCDLALRGLERGKEPVAWMTAESMSRIEKGGNGSRQTVPVHSKPSCVAKIPLYASAPPAASGTESVLRAALLEVKRVLESNTTAIVDTVWVSTGAPETLLDHVCAALDAPAARGTVQVPRKHLEHLRDDHPLLEHLVRQWASEMLSAAPEVKP